MNNRNETITSLALVFGILSVVSRNQILSLIFGVIGFSFSKEALNKDGGDTVARAGYYLSIIGLILAIIFSIACIFKTGGMMRD